MAAMGRMDVGLAMAEAFHVVLLDNRRSDILGSDYQDMLRCMRCSACLNHCPIYLGAGGNGGDGATDTDGG